MATTTVISVTTPTAVPGNDIVEQLAFLVSVLNQFLAGPFTGTIFVDPDNAGHYGPVSRTDPTDGTVKLSVELNPPAE